MSKICNSCGALNSDLTNICTRCGKSISFGNKGRETKKIKPVPVQNHSVSGYIIIVVLVVLFALVLLYKFMGEKRIPQLTEAECEQIFSNTIRGEKDYLKGVFQEERRDEPIACSITDIKQDGKSAVVTYKLSAKYNYADFDLTCRCNAIYIDTTETWCQTESTGRECKVNYHDLGGVWQEKESFYSEPKIIYVSTIPGGYTFTATANWNSDERGTEVEILMDDLEPDNRDGESSIFNFPHAAREHFCLSPEEGITDMEKIQDEWASDFDDDLSEDS